MINKIPYHSDIKPHFLQMRSKYIKTNYEFPEEYSNYPEIHFVTDWLLVASYFRLTFIESKCHSWQEYIDEIKYYVRDEYLFHIVLNNRKKRLRSSVKNSKQRSKLIEERITQLQIDQFGSNNLMVRFTTKPNHVKNDTYLSIDR